MDEAPGLDNTQRYLVPLLTDDEGRATAALGQHVEGLGTVLYLFTSRERADGFVGVLSEDLNVGHRYSSKTVEEMLLFLEDNDIDTLVVDPGLPGEGQRVYESPHKA